MKTLSECKPTISEHCEVLEKDNLDFCGFTQDDIYESAVNFYETKIREVLLEHLKVDKSHFYSKEGKDEIKEWIKDFLKQ